VYFVWREAEKEKLSFFEKMANKAEIIKQNLAFMYGRNQEDVKNDPDKRSLVRTAGRNFIETDMITNFSLPEYDFLSPNYSCIVYLAQDTIPYPSYEHALQASKTNDMTLRKLLSEIVEVKEVKRKVSKLIKLNENWKEKSLIIAEQLLRDKFFRSKELQRKLMQTNHRKICYVNTFHDHYWGMDGEGKGQNHYGKLLELIRESIENDSIEKKWISDHFQLENPENLMIRITSHRHVPPPPPPSSPPSSPLLQKNEESVSTTTAVMATDTTETFDSNEEEEKEEVNNETVSFEHLAVLHIGKSSQNDLILPTPTASRYHALLLIDQRSQLILIDLNSANGTYLHNSATAETREVAPPMIPISIKSGVTEIQFGVTQRRYVVEVDLHAEHHRREQLYSKLSNPTELFSKDSEAETTIFVGNLSYSCTEADLTQTFTPCGPIRQIKIPKDPATREGRGIAFVIFETIGGLRQALIRDGDLLNGRPMKVKRSEAKSDPSLGKGSGAGRTSGSIPERRERGREENNGGSRSYYQPRDGGDERAGGDRRGGEKEVIRRRDDDGRSKRSQSDREERPQRDRNQRKSRSPDRSTRSKKRRSRSRDSSDSESSRRRRRDRSPQRRSRHRSRS
jgi:RNA recognition motif-containing protein/predicted NAD-dependent protein-ADP-ribosyltransferase YbiA (DUF1768 family)